MINPVSLSPIKALLQLLLVTSIFLASSAEKNCMMVTAFVNSKPLLNKSVGRSDATVQGNHLSAFPLFSSLRDSNYSRLRYRKSTEDNVYNNFLSRNQQRVVRLDTINDNFRMPTISVRGRSSQPNVAYMLASAGTVKKELITTNRNSATILSPSKRSKNATPVISSNLGTSRTKIFAPMVSVFSFLSQNLIKMSYLGSSIQAIKRLNSNAKNSGFSLPVVCFTLLAAVLTS